MAELIHGKTDKEIARALGISESTVGTHMRTICSRLDARNRVEAAVKYVALDVPVNGVCEGLVPFQQFRKPRF